MSVRYFIVVAILFAITGRAQNDLKIHKVVTDAIEIDRTLTSLSFTNKTHPFLSYQVKIREQFDALQKQCATFSPYSCPIELTITEKNKKNTTAIAVQLHQIMAQIRMVAKKRTATFSAQQKYILLALLSENPGDYYSCINPQFEFRLHNHPLKNQQEFIGLQDISFLSILTQDDTSLWKLSYHCPNLKFISIFRAELNDKVLQRLSLDKLGQLKGINLAGNTITELPPNFNQSNTLTFLNLSNNKITFLPENINQWNLLEYLNLKQNPISLKEQERIKKALPNATLLF